MADYIVGKRAILEALDAGVAISCAFAQTQMQGVAGTAAGGGGKKNSDLEKLLARLRANGANIEYVPKKKLDSMLRDKRGEGDARGDAHAPNHQGIVAKVAPYKYAELSDVLSVTKNNAQASTIPELIVVCDHICDSGNFGAVIRSAEAFGAVAVVIPNRRSANVNASVYKTSAGAVFNIPIVQVVNIANTLDALKEAGFWVAAATEHATCALAQANLKGNIAFVVGSEGEGISPLVQKRCDFSVAIPMYGRVESLNVAQAASVCMYEWARQNAVALDEAAGAGVFACGGRAR